MVGSVSSNVGTVFEGLSTFSNFWPRDGSITYSSFTCEGDLVLRMLLTSFFSSGALFLCELEVFSLVVLPLC